ncbi:MAG: apolipoprotein N-acyltransferase, partial [Candidatus Omnitrophica bacterium]|nr:apolipoprotein N-acyltransferase [Candidatus Omnitrophota bacterium]
MLRKIVLVICSASLLCAAFPPMSVSFFGCIALVPLFLALERVASKRAAFGVAYLTGLLFFISTLQWIHYVTWPGLVLLSAYLALYVGVFGIFYHWAKTFPLAIRLWLIPAGWVVLEYIRGTALTGFGWVSLGHMFSGRSGGMSTLAQVTGVAGFSFLIVFANVLCREAVDLVQQKSRPGRAFIAALGVVLLCLLAARIPVAVMPKKNINVAVIQGNISFKEFWNDASKPLVIDRQLELSRQALKQKPQLIVWPETAFPHFMWDHPALVDKVTAFARAHQVYLLIGAVTKEGEKYFNSAVLIGPDGNIVGTRNKRHLVLFGEYIPFRKELPFLADLVPIDDFTPGAEDAIFDVPGLGKFGVLVCFEDTIPELARRYTQEGAEFLVNITNDAWFEDSGQLKMHLDNAQFRAYENGRALVRATNTGRSCIIDPSAQGPLACVQDGVGRAQRVAGFAVASIGRETRQTFYTKYGDVFTGLCFLGILSFMLSLRMLLSILLWTIRLIPTWLYFLKVRVWAWLLYAFSRKPERQAIESLTVAYGDTMPLVEKKRI